MAQLASAFAWGAKGRRFESCHPGQKRTSVIKTKYKQMNNSNVKCEWLGIGSDVWKESELFKEITIINEILNSKYNGVSVFSDTNRPHLNMYDLDVPTENIPQVISELEDLLKDRSGIKTVISKLEYFPFGLFYLKLEATPELKTLHRSIVEKVSKYKGNCVCKDYLKPRRKYNIEQKEMLKIYGNPFVINQYFPHITLGFVKNNNSRLEKIRLELLEHTKTKAFMINNIQVVRGEETGYKLVREINLK